MLQSLFLHYSGGYAFPRLSLSLTGCGKSIKTTHFCRLWDSLGSFPSTTDCLEWRVAPGSSYTPFLLSFHRATQVRSEDSPCLLRLSPPCLHVIAPKEHQACLIPSGSRMTEWAGLRIRERQRVEMTPWHKGTHEENDWRMLLKERSRHLYWTRWGQEVTPRLDLLAVPVGFLVWQHHWGHYFYESRVYTYLVETLVHNLGDCIGWMVDILWITDDCVSVRVREGRLLDSGEM